MRLLLLALLPAVALANPAPVGSPGKGPVPLPPGAAKGISLVEEEVVLTDGLRDTMKSFAPGGPPIELNVVGYKGTYLLKNTTAERRQLKIGFPVVVGSFRAGSGQGDVDALVIAVRGKKVKSALQKVPARGVASVSALLDLGVRVEDLERLRAARLALSVEGEPDFVDLSALGSTASARRAEMAKVSGLAPASINAVVDNLTGESDFSFSGELRWYTFEVAFAPRETVEVVVTYRSTTGYAGDERRFHYVLTTARRWDGPIARCRVVIEPAKGLAPARYRIRPEGFLWQETRWLLDQSQFTPTEDVVVDVLPP
jgi:hypothetical protein